MPEMDSGTSCRSADADKTSLRVAGFPGSPISASDLPFTAAGRTAIRRKAAKVAFGAFAGCILMFGPGVTLQDSSDPSTGFERSSPGIVLVLDFSKAYAESRRTRRIRRKREAARKAAEERQKEADRKLLDNRLASLPAHCAYDSFASFSSPTEIHFCGAFYYRPYEEDGVAGYEGYPIGSDPAEIDRAKARRAKAREKRLAEAEKKLKADRKTSLSTDCAYDSFASFAVNSNVYSCGGVQFMQVRENGVTVYDRRGNGAVSRKIKQELARRAKAQADRRAISRKALQRTRRAALPKGCTYDSYASFFTSSNVYSCAGVRYRQYSEAGTTGFEEINL